MIYLNISNIFHLLLFVKKAVGVLTMWEYRVKYIHDFCECSKNVRSSYIFSLYRQAINL